MLESLSYRWWLVHLPKIVPGSLWGNQADLSLSAGANQTSQFFLRHQIPRHGIFWDIFNVHGFLFLQIHGHFGLPKPPPRCPTPKRHRGEVSSVKGGQMDNLVSDRKSTAVKLLKLGTWVFGHFWAEECGPKLEALMKIANWGGIYKWRLFFLPCPADGNGWLLSPWCYSSRAWDIGRDDLHSHASKLRRHNHRLRASKCVRRTGLRQRPSQRGKLSGATRNINTFRCSRHAQILDLHRPSVAPSLEIQSCGAEGAPETPCKGQKGRETLKDWGCAVRPVGWCMANFYWGLDM